MQRLFFLAARPVIEMTFNWPGRRKMDCLWKHTDECWAVYNVLRTSYDRIISLDKRNDILRNLIGGHFSEDGLRLALYWVHDDINVMAAQYTVFYTKIGEHGNQAQLDSVEQLKKLIKERKKKHTENIDTARRIRLFLQLETEARSIDRAVLENLLVSAVTVRHKMLRKALREYWLNFDTLAKLRQNEWLPCPADDQFPHDEYSVGI